MRLIVMKLVENGLLTLKQDSKDRRAYLVHISATGRALAAQERSARSQWLAEQLLEKTDPEQRALLKTAIQTLDVYPVMQQGYLCKFKRPNLAVPYG
jgi:DNA-binding MarR family transcriptional regulator